MTPLDLLLDLDRRGIALTAPAPGRLLAEPGSALTAADVEGIRQHKPRLLALLAAGMTPEAVRDVLAECPPDWSAGPVQLVERELVALDGKVLALPVEPRT